MTVHNEELEAYRLQAIETLKQNGDFICRTATSTLERPCRAVYIVGSVLSKSTFTASSDVDVAVVVEGSNSETGLSEKLSEDLQREMQRHPLRDIGVVNTLVFVNQLKLIRGRFLKITGDTMPAHNAYLGEVVHHLKSGHVRRFKPQGEIHTIGPRGRIMTASEAAKSRTPRAEDKVERLPTGGLAARIFVGLNVGPETKYTLEDVMREALKVRKAQGKRADGSFLAQKGIYEDTKGRIIEEPSVQIILIDLEGTPEKTWTTGMLKLAKHLRRKFHQEAVILEIQKRGIVEAVYSITA